MHGTWTGDSFHIWYYTYFNAILPNHPTLSLSHRVQDCSVCLHRLSIWSSRLGACLTSVPSIIASSSLLASSLKELPLRARWEDKTHHINQMPVGLGTYARRKSEQDCAILVWGGLGTLYREIDVMANAYLVSLPGTSLFQAWYVCSFCISVNWGTDLQNNKSQNSSLCSQFLDLCVCELNLELYTDSNNSSSSSNIFSFLKK